MLILCWLRAVLRPTAQQQSFYFIHSQKRPPRIGKRGVCVGEISGLINAAALYKLALGMFEPVRPFHEDSEPSELTVLLSNSPEPGLPL